MDNIKFNCPQCDQHLVVDATVAGATVACPKCGQAILVPQLARVAAAAPIYRATPAAKTQTPKRTKWWMVAAGGIAVAILAAGVLIWRAEKTSLTPEALYGKQFHFDWKTEKNSGNHGIVTLHNDGTISGGSGSPNETFWLIDEKRRLIFKHRDGRISTIFTHEEQRSGKWLFSGPFQFEKGVEHSLEEVSSETIGSFSVQLPTTNKPQETHEQPAAKIQAAWVKALNEALSDLQTYKDQESVNLVSGILASLNQPGGLAPNALAGDVQHMKDRVRELVRQGALDSAAALNLAQCKAAATPGIVSPPHPNHKIGGKPGPGGLVLYLPLDKPDNNGIVHDESGAGNDGQVFGAQWVPEGKFGGAYRFSLTNFDDRIVIPNGDTLNPDYITIAAWVKAADKDGFWNCIVDKYSTSGYILCLGGDWNGKKLRGKLWFEADPDVAIGSNQALDDNRWHHIAATFDGKTECCYIDGVEKSRLVKNPGPLRKSNWDLCIGNTVVDDGTEQLAAFDGLIDEVRIYNRALSPDEIKTLATATNAGVDVLSVPADMEPKADTAGRLRKVKELYDQGLITKEQYDQKVKEIMDSL